MKANIQFKIKTKGKRVSEQQIDIATSLDKAIHKKEICNGLYKIEKVILPPSKEQSFLV